MESAAGTDRFTSSVREVLTYLATRTGLPNWSVSRVVHGEQVHLHVEADELLSVGLRIPWHDTFCHRMVTGLDNVVPDTVTHPDYHDLPVVPTVRAYAGAPVQGPDGTLFGILCGVSPHPLAEDDQVDDELVRVFGRLLSAQLAAAREHDLATSRERRARAAAETDALTGLLNRRGWDEALAAAQERSDTYGDPVGVILIDLDGLKQVNDSRGHEAGDALIRATATALRDAVRPEDLVSRFGGDEFTVLLGGLSAAGLVPRIEHLLSALSSAGIRASAGGDVAVPGERTLAEALAEADARMYEAKRGARA